MLRQPNFLDWLLGISLSPDSIHQCSAEVGTGSYGNDAGSGGNIKEVGQSQPPKAEKQGEN